MKGGRTLPETFRDADELAARIIEATGGEVRLALPLGLGKPVTLLNALTRAACNDASVTLSIFTALTLEAPAPGSDMAIAQTLVPSHLRRIRPPVRGVPTELRNSRARSHRSRFG